MAHPLICPSCSFTTRVSDELYARRVKGRRVKIACKGCREPLLVDATGPRLGITLKPPASRAAARAAAIVPSAPPLARARELQEEELPTLRRNEVPTDEAFLPSVATSEAPATSWLQTIPPLGALEPTSSVDPSRRRMPRFVALGLLGVCFVAGAAWASWIHRPMSDLVDRSEGAGRPLVVPAQSASESAPQRAAARGSAEFGASSLGATTPIAAAEGRTADDSAGVAGPPRHAASAPRHAASAPRHAVGAAQNSTGAPTDAVGATQDAAGAAPNPVTAATDTAGETSEPPETTESPAETELQPFDKGAAAASLRAAEGQAGACRSAGDPSGTARVVVTFAPSGRATTATVSGAPFAGTSTGGCIAGRFRSVRVPPFAGSHVTVTKTVVVR